MKMYLLEYLVTLIGNENCPRFWEFVEGSSFIFRVNILASILSKFLQNWHPMLDFCNFGKIAFILFFYIRFKMGLAGANKKIFVAHRAC